MGCVRCYIYYNALSWGVSDVIYTIMHYHRVCRLLHILECTVIGCVGSNIFQQALSWGVSDVTYTRKQYYVLVSTPTGRAAAVTRVQRTPDQAQCVYCGVV